MQKQFSFYKNYELLDCGDLRRLERFGDIVIDRPAKQADFAKKLSKNTWDKADAVFVGDWSFNKKLPESFVLDLGPAKMELKFTASGQIGIFPEQGVNWEWLLKLSQGLKKPVSTINCFAYTGASSLFASLLGEVCHVDGSKPAVKWASDNVTLSGLQDKSIRWIVEDVLTYMKREVKRGKKYNGFILDPPAFGRGKDGKVWSLQKNLDELIELSSELCNDDIKFFILSAHDPQIAEEDLREVLLDVKGIESENIETLKLEIESKAGNSLPCGVCARFKNC